MRIFAAVCVVIAVTASSRVTTAQQQIPLRTITADLRITANDVPSTEVVVGVSGLAVAADGMIFSSDQREARIRVHDANGKFVRAFGTKGEGPGEFTGRFPISFRGIRGDSLFTHENTGPGSVLLFRTNGTYVGMPLASRRGDRVIVAFLPGARSLVRIGHRPSSARSGRGGSIAPADSDTYEIMDSLGNSLSRLSRGLTRYENIRPVRAQPGLTGPGTFAQPFYFPVDAAADPSGLRAVVVSQWIAWGGAPGEVKLAFTTGTGNPVERIVKFEPRRLTPAMVNQWIRERLDAMGDGLSRSGTPRAAAEAEIRNQLHVPEYLPIFDDAFLGIDGAVWLKLRGQSLDAPRSTQPGEWAVISPAGSIAYRVSIPPAVRVQQVSMGQIWALQTDSDGLPIIVRYRVN